MVDLHCDSILAATGGTPLVKPYNFSTRPQLQLVALFAREVAPGAAFFRTLTLLRRFHAAVKQEKDKIRQVRSAKEIQEALSCGRHAALLSLEGGACLAFRARALLDLVGMGVRVMGLCWETNCLAESSRHSGRDTGLSALGRVTVARGNSAGVIFDVSHLSDASFWEVMALAERPPLATHSNFRAVAPHPRNLTDDMARALAVRGGLIGLNLYPPFLHREPTRATVEALFSHVDHALSLIGPAPLCFGFDIDGTDGHYPVPLDLSRSLHGAVVEEMLRHNYADSLIEDIAHRNAMRYFEKNL